MKTYTLLELQDRYKLQKSAMHKFLARHMGEINQNGKHAFKTQNKWVFDDFALGVLDKLRGIGQVIPADQQIVADLQKIIENLRQELIVMQKANIKCQEEISGLKDKLIFEMQEKANIKDKLASASFELLRLQSSENDISQLFQEKKVLENELKTTKTIADQLAATVKKMEEKNKALKKGMYKSTIRTRRRQPARIKINATK